MAENVTSDFDFWKWLSQKIWAAWGMVAPSPEHRGVSQGIEFVPPQLSKTSWLHVDIGMRRFLWMRQIPNCEIWAKVKIKDKIVERQMRWRSDLEAGSREIDLITGVFRSVPIVLKHPNRDAELTDGEWLDLSIARVIPAAHGSVVFLPLGGVYEMELIVFSGSKRFELPWIYKITVPAEDEDNTRFGVTATRKDEIRKLN
jgi:hypothetical protein